MTGHPRPQEHHDQDGDGYLSKQEWLADTYSDIESLSEHQAMTGSWHHDDLDDVFEDGQWRTRKPGDDVHYNFATPDYDAEIDHHAAGFGGEQRDPFHTEYSGPGVGTEVEVDDGVHERGAAETARRAAGGAGVAADWHAHTADAVHEAANVAFGEAHKRRMRAHLAGDSDVQHIHDDYQGHGYHDHAHAGSHEHGNDGDDANSQEDHDDHFLHAGIDAVDAGSEGKHDDALPSGGPASVGAAKMHHLTPEDREAWEARGAEAGVGQEVGLGQPVAQSAHVLRAMKAPTTRAG